MAKTKRGRESETTPARESKRRKAAETSMAKMKEIAAAEEVDEATEFAEPKDVTTIDADVEEEEGEIEDVPRPVVAPGFRVWKTSSIMTSGGLPSNVPTWDAATKKYSQVLDIQSNEFFTLLPLVVTQGPYQGRQIFMLEPTSGFRFLDFPPEIRNLIYSFLLEEEGGITIDTTKPVHKPRRPVVSTFRQQRLHPGLEMDKTTNKWINQPPSNLAVLRTNKQIFEETAPIVYGNNHFYFGDLVDLRIFLDQIGHIRPYLQHIHLSARAYRRTKANAAFGALKDAYGLRTLAFQHQTLCRDEVRYYDLGTSPQQLAYQIKSMLSALKSKHVAKGEGFNVLDIIKLEWERCEKCTPHAPGFAPDEECINPQPIAPWGIKRNCETPCKDLEKHCRDVEKKVRTLVAKQIGITE